MYDECRRCGAPAEQSLNAPLCLEHYRYMIAEARESLNRRGGAKALSEKTWSARQRKLRHEAAQR